MPIPKILHQIWIGPKPPPIDLMNSWKHKNPHLEYIFWNEQEIKRRNITFKCQKQISAIKEINGAADIIRWEILQNYGGIFVDADSICIEPFDDSFFQRTGFSTFENKNIRQDLIATGTMGFIPNHPLVTDIVESIAKGQHDESIEKYRAWVSVGPALLTNFLNTGKYKDITIYPSHYFLPIHFTGITYEGHKKVYGYQEWGTAKQSYDTMNSVVLPDSLLNPSRWVSVMVTSYNTHKHHIHECLESIRSQNGHFGIELVWINDGSDEKHTQELENKLKWFEKNSRFVKIVYHKHFPNSGTAFSNNIGILKCSNELIFKMDSDDIMVSDRLKNQIHFMDQNPNIQVCGTNMKIFKNTAQVKECIKETHHHDEIDWAYITQNKPSWFANHPTLCYRRSAVLSVGNYNVYDPRVRLIQEDYDLELRLINKYGKLVNLPQCLLLYRLHDGQLTKDFQSDSEENAVIRNRLIENIGQYLSSG